MHQADAGVRLLRQQPDSALIAQRGHIVDYVGIAMCQRLLHHRRAPCILSAQCSKVGSNLNQLARHFNSGGKDTEQLRAQILEELSALTNFRLKAEETVGELYGNHQAFKLEEL